jgi:hypothetical protein
MTSITTFGYGLTVRATELITAAQAWRSLEPIFQFFDLLFLRRRTGTLKIENEDSSKASLIQKVPVEVWEEVRKRAVLVEMEEKEDEFLRPFRIDCEDAEDCEDCRRGKMSWELLRRDTAVCNRLEHLLYHDSFRDMLDDLNEGRDKVLDVSSLLYARLVLGSVC